MKRYLIITVHIAAWLCLFLLPFVFSPRFRDPNFQFSEPFIYMMATLDLYMVAFFYANTEIFIPKLLTQKKWLWYFLVITLCLVVFILLPKLFEDAIRAELPREVKERIARRKRSGGGSGLFNGSTAVFFLVFTVSTCMRVMKHWLALEKKKKEVENDKVVTELSFLKTQINPHFLFNTLNNIYSLAVVKSDATAGAVLKLSSIMRYVLQETKHDWVLLENEIKFINDYLELQKVRLTDKVKIDFTVNGDVSNRYVAPLIFIPFIENAFKYGISAKDNSAIFISINVLPNAVELKVDNDIVAAETDKFENTGIGLQNTRRRLELLYPASHQLDIKKDKNKFKVHLTLSK